MKGSEPERENIFEVERVRKFVELMEQHELTEIDLKQRDQRIRLRRGPEMVAAMPSLPTTVAAAANSTPNAAAPAPKPPQAKEDDAHIKLIESPMVGTFYSRANPDAEPFVKIGDHISAETTVCIIEAMKVFNEIAAEISGKIVAILVDNEEPVEFGKPLFKVDTST